MPSPNIKIGPRGGVYIKSKTTGNYRNVPASKIFAAKKKSSGGCGCGCKGLK
jgi:hypothetical protein